MQRQSLHQSPPIGVRAPRLLPALALVGAQQLADGFRWQGWMTWLVLLLLLLAAVYWVRHWLQAQTPPPPPPPARRVISAPPRETGVAKPIVADRDESVAPADVPPANPPGTQVAPTAVSEPIVNRGPTAVADEPAPETEPTGPDDLRRIWGIGPKIATLLAESGIVSYRQLATIEPDKLASIMAGAGARYRLAVTDHWGPQAALAADGQWVELKAYQAALRAARKN